MSENKVRYGLKKAYYAPVTMTGTTPTFGTPVALPGAVSLSIEPQGETNDFYADDGIYFSTTSNTGYEGTLELAEIPNSFLTTCLGMTTDNDNLVVETSDDTASYFALLFEFSADQKAIRHCMYYCLATRPKQEGETKGESIEPKTTELSFKAQPIPGTNIVKAKSQDTTTSTRYNSWYTTVALPDFPELTVSPNPATYNDADVALTVTGGTVSTIKLNGTAVASTNYTISGSTVTLKSADYLEDFEAGEYRFELSTSGGDNGIAKVIIPE